MMKITNELKALFSLMDDPDEEVFEVVSNKLRTYGKEVIPNLEYLWENSIDLNIHQRIDTLIHQLHFSDLLTEVSVWSETNHADLISGALLVAKFQYPELEQSEFIKDIEGLRKNVWMELNTFLTPLEQANVLSSILYNYYKLKGMEVAYNSKEEFFINRVLAKRKGNALTNAIIYQVICESLEINARIINIPFHFMIAFYHDSKCIYNTDNIHRDNIHFFIDPTSGEAHSHIDINTYLKRMKLKAEPSFFAPMDNKKIIKILIEELSKCYQLPSEKIFQSELMKLSSIIV